MYCKSRLILLLLLLLLQYDYKSIRNGKKRNSRVLDTKQKKEETNTFV